MRKVVIAANVTIQPTPGTKAGSIPVLSGSGKIKKAITIGHLTFSKGSIVSNLPGGVFILDPKADPNVRKSETQELGSYHAKFGYSVRRTEDNLKKIAAAL